MRNIRLSIKLPLLIVIMAVVVVTAIMSFVIFIVQDNITNTEDEANTNSVKSYASAIDFYVNGAKSVIEITDQQVEAIYLGKPSLPETSANKFHDSLHDMAASMLEHSDVFEYIVFLAGDGSVDIVEPYELKDKLTRNDMGFTSWYKKLVSTGQTVVSDLHISTVTQRPTVLVATPVHNSNGQIIGVWLGGLNLSQVSQMGSLPGATRNYGFITDSRGLIIAHQQNPKYVEDQTDFSSTPPVKAALIGKQGTIKFVSTIDGIEKLAAYMPVSTLGWIAVYQVSTQVAFANMNILVGYLAGLAVLMIIVMGIGGLFIARRLTMPLGQLTTAAEKLGSGDLNQRIQIKGGDEIGILGTEFNLMAASLKEHIEQREKAERERIKAESGLASAKLARDMIDSMMDAVIMTDLDGRITHFNRATTSIFGYGEEIIGQRPTALVVERDSPTVYEVIKETMEKGFVNNREHTGITKEGKEFPVLVSAAIMTDIERNPTGIIGVVKDITDLRKAEESLRETNEYLENLFNYASGPIIVWDPQFRITRFNYAFEILTGRNAKDVIGKSLEILFPPSQMKTSMKLIRNTLVGERWQVVEISVLHLDGNIRAVLWNSAPIFARDGKTLVATIAQGQDITERKMAEENLKQRSEDLLRSNAELERFAYVASHDLQEPLRMVASYTQLLERRYKDKLDADANDFINFAVNGAKRMQLLLDDLLTYSRVGTRGKSFELTDCQEVFNAAIANLDIAIRESGAKVTNDPLPIVKADKGQLVQLLQNLIGNAVKFHDKRIPEVHVSAKLEADIWVFSVKDNGIGIDSQYFDRVFVIFQRLQSSDFLGSGVGLSISKKIVERHGGRIWIESQIGEGSTFFFTLSKITQEEELNNDSGKNG